MSRADVFRWRSLPPHPLVPPLPKLDEGSQDRATQDGASAAGEAAGGTTAGGEAAGEAMGEAAGSTKMRMVLAAVREAAARGEKLLVFSCYVRPPEPPEPEP